MNRHYFAGLSLVFVSAFSGLANGSDFLPFPSPMVPIMIPSEHLMCLVTVKHKQYVCELPTSVGSLQSGCACIVDKKTVHGYVVHRP